MVLHGDGSPTRRYLFAGDAADAFDTILHKGTLGHIYNVGSYDEISNIQLCGMLLKELGIASDDKAEFDKTARNLVSMFQKNFEKYEKHVDADVRAAAPDAKLAAE